MSDSKRASGPLPAIAELVDPATPWAIKPSVLAVLTAVMRREVSVEQAQQQLAARGGPAVKTAGAVAVLTLRGTITPRGSFLSFLFGGGGGGLEGFREQFREAVADKDVASILIDIDSPGGLVDLVPETAAEIREARGTKPIVAIANTQAASAAFWIASQADELVVTPSGEVGSVGVYVAHEDWSGYDEKLGVATTLISAGKYKTEANPWEPLSKDAKAAIQQTVDEIYDQFVDDVAAGRGTSAATVKSSYGEGRVLPAARALDAGMVDRVATFDDVVAGLIAGQTPSRPAATAEHLADHSRALEELKESVDRMSAAIEPGALTVSQDPSSPPPPAPREGAAAVPPWLLIPTPRH